MKDLKILRTREGLLIFPAIWNGDSQTHPKQEEIHGTRLKTLYFYLQSNNKFYSGYPKKEWSQASEKVKDKMIEDTEYISRLYNEQKKYGEELVKYSEKIQDKKLSQLEEKELLEILEKLREKWIEYEFRNLYPWYLGGDKFQKEIRKKLKEEGLNLEEIEKCLTPPKLSFSTEEELDIHKLASTIKSKEEIKNSSAEEAIKKLNKEQKRKIADMVESYYWIPFGYGGPETYDQKYYIQEAQQLLKEKTPEAIQKRIQELQKYEERTRKEQEEIRKKHDIREETWELVKKTHILTYMTDERKENQFPSHIAVDQTLRELSKKIEVKRKHLKMFSIQEMKKYSAEKLRKEGKKRYEERVLVIQKDGSSEITRDEQKIQEIEEALNPGGEDIEGTVGSQGEQEKIQGTVKILPTPDNLDKVEEEDILVTGMTTPEFVPAMRKASAIITDEGGMTCHAAIVSRELNKPCIIGTGNATQTLEDGDKVEIDTEEGKVQKKE